MSILAGPLLLWTCFSAPVLPGGFIAQDVAPSILWDTITGLDVAPDGRIFVLEKRGRVYVVESNIRLPTPFLDLELEVLNNGDRGLLGLALDPNFPQNGFVYLLYTVDPNGDGVDDEGPTFGRLARYTVSLTDRNVADPASRFILLGQTWTTGVPSLYNTHTIGSLRFGVDGSLLVSTGDGAHAEVEDAGGKDPTGFGPGKLDSQEDIGAFRSQWIGSMAGKILRLNSATGGGLPSNPFYTGNPFDNSSRVWAYGLRNPFRFAVRPGTGSSAVGLPHPGTLLIADVGWRTWEEINVCGQAGMNFGWPCFEAMAIESAHSALTPAHHGCSTIGTTANPASPTPPVVCWHHAVASLSSPPGHVGKAASAVGFYRGTRYPSEYWGAGFFGDFDQGWIQTIALDEQNRVVSVGDFASGAEGPVDISADPTTGDLFFVSILRNKIWRIRHGVAGNPPVAIAMAGITSGAAPLAVQFSSDGSRDPEGSSLSYAWHLGDGAVSTEANPIHTYAQPGVYEAILSVLDSDGGQGSVLVTITVTGPGGGNQPPLSRILEPADASSFHPQAPLVLKGSATDAEDPISGLRFTWEIALHHNTHVHPTWQVLEGQEVSFLPGEHDDGTGVFLEVVLRVTDTQGLSGTKKISIFPEAQPLILDNGNPGTSFTGNWPVSGAVRPYGSDSVYSKISGQTYTYTFELPSPGAYKVYAWWTEFRSRTTAAPYTIRHSLGTDTVRVDQTRSGDQWNILGTFTFDSTAVVAITAVPGGLSTCADAVLLLPVRGVNLPPLARIDRASPSLAFQGETITFAGHGEDDGTIVAYRWGSSLDGLLSSEPAFIISSLTKGGHTISFRVQDNQGVWSESATSILQILEPQIGDEVIVDNGAPGTSFTGSWNTSGASNPYGLASLFSKVAGDAYSFEMLLSRPGQHEVYAWWTATSNRGPSVPYAIGTTAGTMTTKVNQRFNGGRWNYLGSFELGTSVKITVTGVGGGASTCADAVRVVRQSGATHRILDTGDPGTSFTGPWIPSGGPTPYGRGSLYAKGVLGTYRYSFSVPEAGTHEILAWWTTVSSRSSAVNYRVTHAGGMTTVQKSQKMDGGQWNSLGRFQLSGAGSVEIEARADGLSYCADAICVRKVGS